MGTKNKPGTYDCYANAHPDEPMFILLGRDPLAPQLVRMWADLCEETRGGGAKVAEARACAEAMRAWQEQGAPTEVEIVVNGRKCHVPPSMVLTYDKVLGMAAMGGTPSMTWKAKDGRSSGIMAPGSRGGLVPQDGLVFNVCHTGNV